MFSDTFFDSMWFTYGLLPLLIFLSRVVDVSMDTLRIVFISKGDKIIAPLLGFFEVLIWLVAITRIMQNLDNITCYIAYAAGFATGNYIGLLIEQRLALGMQIIRVIMQDDSTELINNLRDEGFRVTYIEAFGKDASRVHIIFCVIERQQIDRAIGLITEFNPKAFYSIEDVRTVNPESKMFDQKQQRKRLISWSQKGR
jgi:uncharacterized protein YebE (UPF0316 family)